MTPNLNRVLQALQNVLVWLALFAIACYKAVGSLWLGGACRFTPSCSDYAVVAVQRFGPLKGSMLAVQRIARCRPGSAFGVDEVPDEADGSREET